MLMDSTMHEMSCKGFDEIFSQQWPKRDETQACPSLRF